MLIENYALHCWDLDELKANHAQREERQKYLRYAALESDLQHQQYDDESKDLLHHVLHAFVLKLLVARS